MFSKSIKMFLSLLILASAYLPFYCPKPASAAHDYNVGIEIANVPHSSYFSGELGTFFH